MAASTIRTSLSSVTAVAGSTTSIHSCPVAPAWMSSRCVGISACTPMCLPVCSLQCNPRPLLCFHVLHRYMRCANGVRSVQIKPEAAPPTNSLRTPGLFHGVSLYEYFRNNSLSKGPLFDIPDTPAHRTIHLFLWFLLDVALVALVIS